MKCFLTGTSRTCQCPAVPTRRRCRQEGWSPARSPAHHPPVPPSPYPSDEVEDHAVDVEVEQDRTLTAVDELANHLASAVHAEVDVVVAALTVLAQDPADERAGRRVLHAEHLV